MACCRPSLVRITSGCASAETSRATDAAKSQVPSARAKTSRKSITAAPGPGHSRNPDLRRPGQLPRATPKLSRPGINFNAAIDVPKSTARTPHIFPTTKDPKSSHSSSGNLQRGHRTSRIPKPPPPRNFSGRASLSAKSKEEPLGILSPDYSPRDIHLAFVREIFGGDQ